VITGPAARQQINLTAPTSRICKGKRGRDWVQGDDLVITVGAGQVILAGALTPTGVDQGALHPSLRAARTNCDTAGIPDRIRAHLADAGFASETTFTTPAEGILLICTTNETNQTTRTGDDTDQTPPTTSPARQAMTRRLATPAGQSLYRRRSAMVEPAFAQLFNPGGRRLHSRGPAKHTEITIMITSHNAGKYLRNRHPTKHNTTHLTTTANHS
jgi:DDE family transposase